MNENFNEEYLKCPWDVFNSKKSGGLEPDPIGLGDSSQPTDPPPPEVSGRSGEVGVPLQNSDGLDAEAKVAGVAEDSDDDDWLTDDVKLGPSDKQVRANRENSKKSTGPKTDDGKAKSSQNALKHHIYRSMIEPIQDGTMAEDPDEFFDKVNQLIDAMNPRDAIELELATRFVGVIIKLERNDRWGALSMNDAALMTNGDYAAGARSAFGVRETRLGLGRLFGYLAGGPSLFPKSPPDFQDLAESIYWNGPKPHVKVKGLWDDENTPSTQDQWRIAFETLKKHSWADDAAAVEWLKIEILKMERRLKTLDGMEERIAAKRILAGPFDLQTKYETRLLNNLKTLRKEYVELQKRDLEGKKSA